MFLAHERMKPVVSLLTLLQPFSLGFIITDDWGSCEREIPSEIHFVGKIFTQRIEWHNLNLRIHIKRLVRKTICYSRSVELHEKPSGRILKNTITTLWRHDLQNEQEAFSRSIPRCLDRCHLLNPA